MMENLATTSPLLRVENLHVRLPTPRGELHAVRGISFAVAPGETLCLVGESGCGKSLTALSLIALLPPAARRQADAIEFEGSEISGLDEKRMADIRGDRLAMVFQEPMSALNPAYTIGEQLAEGWRRHRPAAARQARERAVFLLEKVGITASGRRLAQYPHQLSGGLRQRVMIAMALMCEPALIIADEPTTALDVTLQAQILALLRGLQAELGLAIVLITHDLGVVARAGDRMAVMYAGEIVESGPVASVLDSPCHPYTQALRACIPLPGRSKPGTPLGSIPGLVPSLIGGIAGCAFRNRCPQALPECAAAPPVRTAGTDRWFRCCAKTQQGAGT